jgi:DNA-binding LytR/AlgR family response regulator
MLLLYLQEYDPGRLAEIEALCRENLAPDWEARIEYCAGTPTLMLGRVRHADIPALFIMEDARRGDLDAAVAQLRQQNALHYLVLRLHKAEDAALLRPVWYRASGFLPAPIDRDALRWLLESVYEDYNALKAEYGGFFSLKIRGTLYRVAYSKILFFESRGKKIIARTLAQEYEFYDSLEEISGAAPEFFLRTHRSFCVNMRQVSAVNFSERSIDMRDGSTLPFSRTYRQELEAAMKRTKPI